MDKNFLLMSETEILEEVDEYLLYCLYLGFQPELRTRYTSPVRECNNEDAHASWSMFYNTSRLKREFAWKDSGTGEFGDIFKLVQIRCAYRSQLQAIERVKHDIMKPNGQKLLVEASRISVRSAEPAQIRVKSKPFDLADLQWWQSYTSADEQTLKIFNTSRISYFWMTANQKTPSFPGDRAYASRIYDHYMLYFPNRERDRRWRNDFNDDQLPGFCQLAHQSDTVIITKPMKEIICCTMAGFEAVGARGEQTPIPERFMKYLQQTYKYVFTLFDNDGKHRGWSYNCPSIEVPLYTGHKDPTDYHFAHGLPATRYLIHSLIKNHPVMKIDLSQIDMQSPMNRSQLEEFLEKTYLNRIVSIQHVGRKITLVMGKVHRLAVEYDHAGDPLCIAMINESRYEFGLGYFIQKAQIQEHGNSYTANQSD